uniref:Oligopeptide transporter 4 n=1 Tax=Leersia perrieri TaxID=77586 RepID=A0A0D9V376_9ORYZ
MGELVVVDIERALRGSVIAEEDDDASQVEQVRLTVPTTDDPSLPITVQVASLPLGHLLARVLPRRKFRAPALLGGGEWSLNPGPFNMKEHVLISSFANAGCAFGNGNAYAVMIVDIIRAFYRRSISFFAAWLLITTTQVLGYGWAGLMRKYVVEPSQMWWPGMLVQVSLFRALHGKNNEEENTVAEGGGGGMSQDKFFLIALACSFVWYAVPGYLFPPLTSVSWVCWLFSKSVTAQQLGSGMKGLGLGAFTLDWTAVSSFLYSPLVSPFFATANILVGFALFMYVVVPVSYWDLDLYNARRFPIFSSHLFMSNGTTYDITAIVNDRFEIDMDAYQRMGWINLSTFFALSYGLGFATIAATVMQVALFHGKEIYRRFRASQREKPDVHTRLMKSYRDVPSWWFYGMLALSVAVSLVLCTVLKKEVQLPWWGLLFACAMAFVFTLPISIITATTNQTPGLNVLTEYVIGLILPGKPIANVCFKTYGYMSMSQAVSSARWLPRRSTSGWRTGCWAPSPTSAKTRFSRRTARGRARVFFDASVIWGLAGPRRIFGTQGNYGALNWFFLAGAVGPLIVYALHRAFPRNAWVPMINLPVLIGATANMPPATAVNYNSWLFIGVVFNFFVFRYRKRWWKRYNYILSAALDSGVAFMGVLLYFSLSMENRTISWWGTAGEHCPLASCPTAKGINLGPDSVCPVVL